MKIPLIKATWKERKDESSNNWRKGYLHNFGTYAVLPLLRLKPESVSWGSGRRVDNSHELYSGFQCCLHYWYSSVQFSHSVVSDSLRPHGLQHTRLPYPSTTPRACSNSWPWSRWCYPTISSLLLLPSIFPSIRVFSSESVLRIRWPKYWIQATSFHKHPQTVFSVHFVLYLFIWMHQIAAACRIFSCGMWDISSPTRDGTHVSCIGR